MPICDILCLEFLIDHGTDEVIEAEIVLLTTFFVDRSLRIGFAFELGLKATTVLLEEFALLVRGSVRKFVGIDEGSRALSCLSKMLQMGEFRSLRRSLFVIPLVFLQIDFGVTLIGKCAIGVMQMFLAQDQLMLGVEGTQDTVDAR